MSSAPREDAAPDPSKRLFLLRDVVWWGIASIWLLHGLAFKLLNVVPRHRAIVARVVGDEWAGPLTIAVGCAEVLLGVWILSGRARRTAAALQTAMLVAMNGLEVAFARDLLLAPLPMVIANALLLGAAWWCALLEVPAPPRSDESES